jgi:hypothetical protein
MIEIRFESDQKVRPFFRSTVTLRSLRSKKCLVRIFRKGGRVQSERRACYDKLGECLSSPVNVSVEDVMGIMTYVQQFRTGEHAFLHACIKKIDVITQKLVDRSHFRQFRFEGAPIRLEHLVGDKSKYLLHPRQHPRSKHEQTEAPYSKLGWYIRAPPHRTLLLEPHRSKRLLDMLKVQKEAEKELVAQDGLARDDERKRELNIEIELESIDGCRGAMS